MTLVESFRASAPPRQLAIVAAAAAVVCALLVALYFLFLHKPYAVLFSDLRTMDASTIVAELDKKKIPYRLADGGETILVPKDVVDATRLTVMGEDLPLKGMVGFELFNKSDMGLTEFAQKINYQRALQGELARTIMTMETVDTARVHLSLTEPTIFRDDRVPPKASVTVLTRPGKVLTAGAVRGIQRLVAAAVPELDLANVVVLDKRGEVLSGDPSPALIASPLVQARQAVEDYYAGLVRIALQRAYPAGAVEVTVAAPMFAATAPVDGHAPAIETWSPDARSFGLQVSIAAAAPLTEQQLQQFRELAGEAIGLNPMLGDTISVAISPVAIAPTVAIPSANPAPWMTSRPAKTHSSQLSALNIGLALALPLLMLLLAAAFLLEQRRGRTRILTLQERSEYTARLKSLLEQEAADAA